MTDYTVQPIDLQFLGAPHGIAAFLVTGPEGPVLVETGPGSTLATLREALARDGLRQEDVRDVLLTHIHLDHAGAAGWWARQGARVHVHYAGAPHLIDPARLLSSARRIYGNAMDDLWGEFEAAPAQKVYAHHDGDIVEAGGLSFVAHETPGHARHHLVYQLGSEAFVGDAAGVQLPEQAHLRLPTPPPEFELETWQETVARMRSLGFSRIYLTHFGPVAAVSEHWDRVEKLLPAYAARVRAGLNAGLEREALIDDLQLWEEARMRADGVDEAQWPVYANLAPASMSVDGIQRYWKRQGANA